MHEHKNCYDNARYLAVVVLALVLINSNGSATALGLDTLVRIYNTKPNGLFPSCYRAIASEDGDTITQLHLGPTVYYTSKRAARRFVVSNWLRDGKLIDRYYSVVVYDPRDGVNIELVRALGVGMLLYGSDTSRIVIENLYKHDTRASIVVPRRYTLRGSVQGQYLVSGIFRWYNLVTGQRVSYGPYDNVRANYLGIIKVSDSVFAVNYSTLNADSNRLVYYNYYSGNIIDSIAVSSAYNNYYVDRILVNINEYDLQNRKYRDIRMFDAYTRAEYIYTSKEDIVFAAVYCDTYRVAVGTKDSVLTVWNYVSNTAERVFVKVDGELHRSPGSRYILWNNQDSVYICDLRNEVQLHSVLSHCLANKQKYYFVDNTNVVFIADTASVSLVNYASKTCSPASVLSQYKQVTYSEASVNGGGNIASIIVDSTYVVTFEIGGSFVVSTLPTNVYRHSIRWAMSIDSGRKVALCGSEYEKQSLSIYDAGSGKLLRDVSVVVPFMSRLYYSWSENKLIFNMYGKSGSADVVALDAANLTVDSTTLQLHGQYLFDLSADGTTIVTGDTGHILRLYSSHSGKLINNVNLSDTPKSALFSPSGRTVAFSTVGEECGIFSVEYSKILWTATAGGDPQSVLRVSESDSILFVEGGYRQVTTGANVVMPPYNYKTPWRYAGIIARDSSLVSTIENGKLVYNLLTGESKVTNEEGVVLYASDHRSYVLTGHDSGSTTSIFGILDNKLLSSCRNGVVKTSLYHIGSETMPVSYYDWQGRSRSMVVVDTNNIVTIWTPSTSSISSVSNSGAELKMSDLTLFPNPCTLNVMISQPKQECEGATNELLIYNSMGELVYSESSPEVYNGVVDVSRISAGVYMVVSLLTHESKEVIARCTMLTVIR